MVKYTASLFAVALLAVAANASPADYETRDIAEESQFSARELEVLNLVARELTDGEEFTARELEELELYTRSKIGRKIGNFFKKAFKTVKSLIFRREQEDSVEAREFDDELETREFEDSEFEARDFEEFDAREIEELLELFAARELDFDDEMVERDLDFDDEMFERDYEVDELD
ncbi:hypothetical protein DFP72DRAFT_888651 [Ephemerocybe angulata]|uniref:Uncharacterized protein n=1 Tax=Ephemerocybe angulata TaxID=980116 RepID=A0A8H6MAS3_9AGAR|nr:hypothetical protein DFP72DRAFT_888651 [Tulosesus angulatus]